MFQPPHHIPECIIPLASALGAANPEANSREDAYELRRIAMTLHRWHEMECGIDGGCIERDELPDGPTPGIPAAYREGPDVLVEAMGKPFWLDSTTMRRTPIADKETGALRRLAKLMKRYPTLTAYVQGDPRGAALYILRPTDILPGHDVGSYYNRGLAVYK